GWSPVGEQVWRLRRDGGRPHVRARQQLVEGVLDSGRDVLGGVVGVDYDVPVGGGGGELGGGLFHLPVGFRGRGGPHAVGVTVEQHGDVRAQPSGRPVDEPFQLGGGNAGLGAQVRQGAVDVALHDDDGTGGQRGPDLALDDLGA